MEVALFSNSIDRDWRAQTRAWGLLLNGMAPQVLGCDIDDRAFIALFVEDSEPPFWHGYPQDSRNASVNDSVATTWYELGYISRAQMRKIINGERCSR